MLKKNKMAYGIVGIGRFGYALAEELSAAGADILVLDQDEAKIREIRELTENAMVVETLDKNALMQTGIQNCDIVVVCIGEHIDTSILTVLNLVGMGIPKVIAKAKSAEHGEILEKLGAEVVYPERDMAIRLANRLENTRVLDFIQLSEKLNITKLIAPNDIIGKTVAEANLRKKYNINIIAVENGVEVSEAISPEYVFSDGDILIVSGSREDVLKLAES